MHPPHSEMLTIRWNKIFREDRLRAVTRLRGLKDMSLSDAKGDRKKEILSLWEIPWAVWMFLLASFAILSRTLCSHSWKDNSHFHSFLSFNHYEDHKLQYCTALSGSKFSGHFLDPSVNHWNAMELNFLFFFNII